MDTNQKYLYVATVFENIFPRRLVDNMSDWGIFISILIFSNWLRKSNKYLRKYKENLYYLRFLWITVVNVSSCSMEMYKERGNEFGQNGESSYIPQCGTYINHCGTYIRHCGTYVHHCGT